MTESMLSLKSLAFEKVIFSSSRMSWTFLISVIDIGIFITLSQLKRLRKCHINFSDIYSFQDNYGSLFFIIQLGFHTDI